MRSACAAQHVEVPEGHQLALAVRRQQRSQSFRDDEIGEERDGRRLVELTDGAVWALSRLCGEEFSCGRIERFEISTRRDPDERLERDLALNAVARRQRDRVLVELRSFALLVGLDEHDALNARGDEMARAVVARKRCRVRSTTLGGDATAGGIQEGIHLGMHRASEFGDVPETGIEQASRKQGREVAGDRSCEVSGKAACLEHLSDRR
jgi:hypothetical protein